MLTNTVVVIYNHTVQWVSMLNKSFYLPNCMSLCKVTVSFLYI
jgi:hypothetical protein